MKNCTRFFTLPVVSALFILCLTGQALGQATSITNTGFRATEGGGGALTTEWVTGNLGNTWAEGEWVPYQLVIRNVQTDYANLDGLPDILFQFDFTKSGSRFVDLVRSIQVGTSELTNAQGWPADGGAPYPMATRGQIEDAQNDVGNVAPLENAWPGFAFVNLPQSQLNRAIDSTDGTATDAEHIFWITKADLLAAGIPLTTDTIVVYYQLHESRSFIWTNTLQSGYDQSPTDNWGGYLYSLGAYSGDNRTGASFVPGSSGNLQVSFGGGEKTVPIPIPEGLPGAVSGLKWLDTDGNGMQDGLEPSLSGWRISVYGTLEGIDFSSSTLTDGSGNYSFPNLSSGTVWTVKEDAQREVPLESGYQQTYPTIGEIFGQGTGAGVSPPPAGVADVGWEVALTTDFPEQDNMNFGNKLCTVAITCPPDLTIDCTASTDPSNTGEPTVDGNCPPYTVTFRDAINPGNCPEEYVISRTWLVTDDFGNADSCVQAISIVDDTPPVLSGVPADATVECDAVPQPPVVTATDDCDPAVAVFFNETSDGTCPTIITRTWTATDDCGNTVTETQILTVEDTTPPVLSGVPGNVTVECDAVPDPATVTAGDNCDTDVPVNFNESSSGTCPTIITRTWTAVDDCGNQVSASQTITVEDTTAPILSGVPGNLTLECDQPVPDPATVTASDNCDTDVPVNFNESSSGTCPTIITRTWTAVDDCGNQVSASQTITVEDTTSPVLSGVPGDVTVECDAVPGPATVTASDNCDTDVPVNFNESSSGTCPTIITRTWSAVDDCGNQVSATQTITVEDTTSPVLSGVPGDLTLECDQTVPAPPNVTASDNCDTDVPVNFNESSSGTCPTIITRTWTAVDDCGNQVSASQTITVEDTTAPVLSGVPGDLFVECLPPAPATVTATDNCDSDVPVNFSESSSGTCPAIITRTWTAIDDCGNQVSATQTITVEDVTSPTLTGVPGDVTLECDQPVPPPANVIAEDNCDGVRLSFNESSTGTCPIIITRTWTATDVCGNTASATQTITVEDTTPPVFSGVPGDVTVECDAVPGPATVTASDLCDTDVPVNFNESSAGTCPTIITRTWTATDDCGNTASATQTITVEDTTPPVLSGVPGDATLECDQPLPNPPTVTASDNCDTDVPVTFSESSAGTCPTIVTRTWTAVDDCGNQVSASQTITVEDTTSPVLSGVPGDLRVDCVAPAPATVTASDNCDTDVPVTFDEQSSGTCPTIVTRTWTAVDDCGNQVSATQTITVVDEVPPVLVGVPGDATVECDAVPSPGTVTATDNCDSDVPVTFSESSSGTCPTIITRTWTASDDCGNQVTASQVLTVVDTSSPTLVGVPGDATVECDQPVPDPPSVTADDNCDTDVPVTFSETSAGTCPTIITRTWSAVDDCGNQVSATQTITVEDTTAPVCNLPNDASYFQCDPAEVCLDVSASDLCDTDVDCTILRGPGSLDAGQWCYTPSADESAYVVISCVDDCGNACVDSFMVTFDINEAPMVECPTDTTLEQPGELFETLVVITDGDDNLESVSIISVKLDGVETLPDSDPQIDMDGNFSWIVDGRSGLWCFEVEAADECAADTCTLCVRVDVPDEFCGFTQGFYGNEGGTFNGMTTFEIIDGLVTPGSPLVIGKPGRSVTFVDGTENCIIMRLPAGGGAVALPSGLGDAMIDPSTCQTSPGLPVYNSSGHFKNVLLGQTIALSLNVRYDVNLGGLGLCPYLVTQAVLPGFDGLYGTDDDEPDPGPDGLLGTIDDPIMVVNIPEDVLNALAALSLPQTVSGLLELANRGLAGEPTDDASLSEINQGVDAINRGFDECRFLVSCTETYTYLSSSTVAGKPVPTDFELTQNYPNPFNPSTKIEYALKTDAQVDLAVYNIIGQRVATLTVGFQSAGHHSVTWDGQDENGHSVASGIYFYRLQAGEFVETRKMMLLK